MPRPMYGRDEELHTRTVVVYKCLERFSLGFVVMIHAQATREARLLVHVRLSGFCLYAVTQFEKA